MPPKTFGIEHILYLVITTIIMIASYILIAKFCKTEKQKLISVKITAGLLLVVVIINQITRMLYLGQKSVIPYSTCAVISMFFSIVTLLCKKDSKFIHAFCFFAIVSGIIPTFYPNYLTSNAIYAGNNSIFFVCTFTSLLMHSLCYYLGILILLTKYIKPDLKKWYTAPLAYCVLLTYGLFAIKFAGASDSMQINTPIISGTFLDWFHLGVMFFAVYMIFLIIYDCVTQKNNSVMAVAFSKIKNRNSKKEELNQEDVVAIKEDNNQQ